MFTKLEIIKIYKNASLINKYLICISLFTMLVNK